MQINHLKGANMCLQQKLRKPEIGENWNIDWKYPRKFQHPYKIWINEYFQPQIKDKTKVLVLTIQHCRAVLSNEIRQVIGGEKHTHIREKNAKLLLFARRIIQCRKIKPLKVVSNTLIMCWESNRSWHKYLGVPSELLGSWVLPGPGWTLQSFGE